MGHPEQKGAVVVLTIEGGCGGIIRKERVIPGATGARTTTMGQLQVVAGDEVVAAFQPGTWVSWRTSEPGADAPPPGVAARGGYSC